MGVVCLDGQRRRSNEFHLEPETAFGPCPGWTSFVGLEKRPAGFLSQRRSNQNREPEMSSYSFTLKQGDHVLHSIENVMLPDPTEAWGFIQELSSQFPSPGLRVVVKDQEGNVVIMAGLMGAYQMEPQIAA